MFRRKYWRVRQACFSDIPFLMEVDREVWAEITPKTDFLWTAEQFWHQIKVAGDYYFVAEDKRTGELLGYVTAMPLALPRSELESRVTTWENLCSGGDYNTINPQGNALFGVAMGVVNRARQSGIAGDLLIAEFSEVVRHRQEYGFLGGRLPGLAKWLEKNPTGTAEQYYKLRRKDEKLLDPEMRLYELDFKLVKLLPDYFPDPDSHDFGILWEWPNPMPKWLPGWLAMLLFRTSIFFLFGLTEWTKRK